MRMLALAIMYVLVILVTTKLLAKYCTYYSCESHPLRHTRIMNT